jgi:hypothetical protein
MNFPNIPEWLKISSVHLLAIAFSVGVLLFAPVEFLDLIGVTRFVNGFRMWIGFAFLISAALLLARAGASVFRDATLRVRQRWILKRRQRRLHQLTPSEKRALAGYIADDTRTQYFQLEDGVIQGLAAECVIARAASVGSIISGFAYNIQPWAWDYLKLHPQLLGDVSGPRHSFKWPWD